MSRIIRGADLMTVPEPTWLVPGRIPADSIGLIYGQPEAGKSWVAMHIALELAAAGEPVLYVAAERARVLIDRARGWAHHHDLAHPPDTFAVLAGRPQLCSAAGYHELSEAVASERPALIVVDTLAQVTDGIKENEGSDMSRAISRLTALKEQQTAQGHPGTILVVHHEGKDSSRGPRGHSSLFGAADYQIQVARRERTITLTWDKLSAAEAKPKVSYRLDNGVLHDGVAQQTGVPMRASQVWAWIRRNGGEASTGELVEAFAWDAKTVRHACQQHPLIASNGEAGRRSRWIAAPPAEDEAA